jgi:hypothetical protein
MICRYTEFGIIIAALNCIIIGIPPATTTSGIIAKHQMMSHILVARQDGIILSRRTRLILPGVINGSEKIKPKTTLIDKKTTISFESGLILVVNPSEYNIIVNSQIEAYTNPGDIKKILILHPQLSKSSTFNI